MPSGNILSIQNAACETLGTIRKMLRSDGYEITDIRAWKDPIPHNPEGYSAVIILGGPMSVYDGSDSMFKEQALIRNAVGNDTPVLGICLGSQLIAQALGGRVHKGPRKEIGWFDDISVTEEGHQDIFAGLQKKMIKAFQWHGDTYDLPPRATILARSSLYPQAFRIGSAVGLQFHLEVTEALIKEWTIQYANELKLENIKPKDISHGGQEIIDLAAMCKIVYSNFFRNNTA